MEIDPFPCKFMLDSEYSVIKNDVIKRCVNLFCVSP